MRLVLHGRPCSRETSAPLVEAPTADSRRAGIWNPRHPLVVASRATLQPCPAAPAWLAARREREAARGVAPPAAAACANKSPAGHKDRATNRHAASSRVPARGLNRALCHGSALESEPWSHMPLLWGAALVGGA